MFTLSQAVVPPAEVLPRLLLSQSPSSRREGREARTRADSSRKGASQKCHMPFLLPSHPLQLSQSHTTFKRTGHTSFSKLSSKALKLQTSHSATRRPSQAHGQSALAHLPVSPGPSPGQSRPVSRSPPGRLPHSSHAREAPAASLLLRLLAQLFLHLHQLFQRSMSNSPTARVPRGL